MYEDAMKRINEQGGEFAMFAKRVLSRIVCAKRPLTTLELRHALAVEVGTSKLDEGNIPTVELSSVCAGLVTVDEESDIIRLIHYTTHEYFERTLKDWFPDADFDISITCVTYISFDTFNSGFCQAENEVYKRPLFNSFHENRGMFEVETKFDRRLRSNPLYDCAAQNWGYHIHETSKEEERLNLEFLNNESKVSASSQTITDFSCRFGWPRIVPMRGIHLAAYFGLRREMGVLLKSHDPNIENTYNQTPLELAAMNGHESVARLLLESKNFVDNRRLHQWIAFYMVAKNGYRAMASRLL